MTKENKRGAVPVKRDPVRRRHEILTAAEEVLIEHGVAGLTHRAVAARSGMALGTLTRHFPKIADLREATFARIGEETDAYVQEIGQKLAASASPQKVLAKLMHEYLNNLNQVNSTVALMNEVATDPSLRAIAQRFSDNFTKILENYTTELHARALETYFEGAMIHATIYGAPLPEETLLHTINLFFGNKKCPSLKNVAGRH